MNSPKEGSPKKDLESLLRLIQVMQEDRVIKKQVIRMLKMDSYQRRSLLNKWLEQLGRQKAAENLKHALTCLFDDRIAEEV